MRRSTERILCSNVGSLPLTDSLQQLFDGGDQFGDQYTEALPQAVAEIVHQQVEAGLDIVDDGEFSKREGFQFYVAKRMGGIEPSVRSQGVRTNAGIHGRDHIAFPDYYKRSAQMQVRDRSGGGGLGSTRLSCTGPLVYTGKAAISADVERLRAAVNGLVAEPFLPTVSPGNIEHWLTNEYYSDEETFLFGIADALHEEYAAIADAGFIVQVDDPDLADGWQMFPDMDAAAYRSYATLRVEALNHALRDIPEEQIRIHICWGSGRGPHAKDLELAEIVDVMLKIKACCYSIEAANARHEHDWRLWEEVTLPPGKMLMPGVVTHHTDHIEHPELVAWRLKLYADCVGRENVIAGTDCGMVRAAPPEICWAKLSALCEGAQLASERLWRT